VASRRPRDNLAGKIEDAGYSEINSAVHKSTISEVG
jgi:hypothetical protein